MKGFFLIISFGAHDGFVQKATLLYSISALNIICINPLILYAKMAIAPGTVEYDLFNFHKLYY